MKKTIKEQLECQIDFGGTLLECKATLDKFQKKYGNKYFDIQIEWGGGYDESWLELWGTRLETDEEYTVRLEDEAHAKRKSEERAKKRQENFLKKQLKEKEDRKRLYEELKQEFE